MFRKLIKSKIILKQVWVKEERIVHFIHFLRKIFDFGFIEQKKDSKLLQIYYFGNWLSKNLFLEELKRKNEKKANLILFPKDTSIFFAYRLDFGFMNIIIIQNYY